MKKKLLLNVFPFRKSYEFPLLLALLVVSLSLFNPQAFGQVASVNTPAGGFNIDGTLKVNSAVGDWAPGTGAGGYVLQPTGLVWGAVDPSKTTFIRDGYGTTPDQIFNGGQFGDNPNVKWTWKAANTLSKCDIGTVLIHSTTSATSKWLILGGDRLAQTGTSYIDFEFSQGLFTKESNFTFKSVSATGGSLLATGGRTVGDFVLSMEYTNGGAVATVHYYRWELSGSVYKFIEKPIPEPAGVVSAFGRSNQAATEVPFGAFGSNSYAPYAFVEAAVNIDAIFEASCQSVTIRSVFVKTKSSDAYSADLKDFVDPQPVNFVFGNAGLAYGPSQFCQTGTLRPTIPQIPSGTFSAPAGLVLNTTTGEIDLANSTIGTYEITYTPNGGNCIVPAKATITINSLPSAPGVSVINNCDGTSDLTATNYSGTLLWSTGATTASIRVSNAGAYTVTQTNASGCTSTAGSGDAAPRTRPTAGAGDDVTVNCTTPSATLTASGGGTYLWSTGVGTSSTTVTPSTSTTYTVTVTAANGCTATDAVTVTVDKATPTAEAGDNVTVTCTTPSATLTATGGTSYLWSTGATTASITVTPSITTIYTVTVKGANGCTATDAVTVTVDQAPPTAAAGNDETVTCTTPSAQLTASGGSSYLWSTGATTASITVTPSETTTYTVTVKGANGCTSTDAVNVTVDKATPTAEAGNGVTVTCTSPSAILTATGGGTYLWSTGATTASITVTPSTTTTYTVTVKGANGCTATDDVTVTVNKATPSAGAGNDATVNCTTPSATLTATGGISYLWSTGAATTSITVTPSSNTTYTVTVTGANGCTSTDNVSVTVNKTPPATPTMCVVEPSLCGATTGSVTILSPLDEGTNDYEYRMNGGAWQDGTSFTNLAPGSLSGNATGFEARLKSSGCISLPAKSCSSPCLAGKSSSETITQNIAVKEEQTTRIDKAPAEKTNTAAATETITAFIPSKTTARAFPNPFSDNIRFTLQSPQSGRGTLELYNMMGQKVKTVFEGYFQAGKTRNIEYNVPTSQRTNLTWVFRVGDQKMTGKLIGIK